jgi:hypothetical protein
MMLGYFVFFESFVVRLLFCVDYNPCLSGTAVFVTLVPAFLPSPGSWRGLHHCLFNGRITNLQTLDGAFTTRPDANERAESGEYPCSHF